MSIVFEDNTIQVIGAIMDTADAVMEEVAGELESAVKRNTAVDTGQTKNSWQHAVTGSAMAGEIRAVIGSDYQNAIWEEFGTGEYALEGNGRIGGWSYQDASGVWHHTFGKRPRRALYNAYTSLRNPLIQRIQNAFRGL